MSHLIEGSGPPTSAPEKEEWHYIDLDSGKLWVSIRKGMSLIWVEEGNNTHVTNSSSFVCAWLSGVSLYGLLDGQYMNKIANLESTRDYSFNDGVILERVTSSEVITVVDDA